MKIESRKTTPHTMDSTNFYHDLEAMDNFTDIADITRYKAAPEDWFVVITDVVGSTKAIEDGRYKDVNTAGALAAMALANIEHGLDFPFVFGGDGVTVLLPPCMLTTARDVLADVRQTSSSAFGLSLRVGIVPVQDLYAQGYELSVAKLRLSGNTYQAILTGSGVDAAETLIKTPESAARYLLDEDHKSNVHADYTGFACNWQDIPSLRGETVSIIVSRLHTRCKPITRCWWRFYRPCRASAAPKPNTVRSQPPRCVCRPKPPPPAKSCKCCKPTNQAS